MEVKKGIRLDIASDAQGHGVGTVRTVKAVQVSVWDIEHTESIPSIPYKSGVRKCTIGFKMGKLNSERVGKVGT